MIDGFGGVAGACACAADDPGAVAASAIIDAASVV
jgi:hypothetical protein